MVVWFFETNCYRVHFRGGHSAVCIAELYRGGKVIRIEEPIYGGSNGALKIAHDMPEDFWEQLK